MTFSCLSPISLYRYYLRRLFIAAGLHPETHEINGGETIMHCWTFSDPDSSDRADDHRPILVLLHGFGPSAVWQWRRQVGPLSRRFRLVVPDLVFFGRSRSRSDRRSVRFQAESVLALLDGLGVAGRFSVAGTSYGGFVAYEIARICGGEGRVERVVIASSDVGNTAEDGKGLLERAGVGSVSELMLPRDTRPLRALLGLSMCKPPRLLPDFLLRDVLQTLYQEHREEKLELLEGAGLDQISPLTQEVLIVWGEQDGIFLLEKAYKLKKHLGEKVRLDVMKNTAHVPQLEDPDRFNKIVESFLLGKLTSSM